MSTNSTPTDDYTTDGLLPCPFDGCAATIDPPRNVTDEISVQCIECGNGFYDWTMDGIRSLWNARAVPRESGAMSKDDFTAEDAEAIKQALSNLDDTPGALRAAGFAFFRVSK